MISSVHDMMFTSVLWDAALEKYASVTHLTVQLFDVDARLVLGPIHPTPLFQLFDEKQYDPGIFAQCAHRCLAQTDMRPAVTLSQTYGLATVGTSLMLEGKVVGAAVGGYVFADFAQASDIQILAHQADIAFSKLWKVVRQQSPVPQRRLQLHGELLQVLGDALLRENHRARQYEQAAAIIESSDDAIISINLEGIITSWNRGAERLYGYSVRETIGRPTTMLMPPELADEAPGMLMRIQGGESIDHYETVRRRKDGTLLDISLTVSPITDSRGRIVGASKVARDVTERKRAEAAVRCWNEELEERVDERTAELVASQDRLRSLATELNLAEQQERKRLAIELHDHLQQMLVLGKLKLGVGKRLSVSLPACAELIKETDDVLSDALKYTRTLVAELSPPVLRAHGLAAGLTWLGEYMTKYNLAVMVTVPEEEPKLPEDQLILLFQSVRELLINSSKYAGTDKAAVTLEQRDDRLLIEVSDQGVGFDPAAAPMSSGLSSKFGLFSIRERMRSLGGSFDLESAQGQGTKVILSLPLVDRDMDRACDGASRRSWLEKERSSQTTTGGSLMRRPDVVQVLLVDDHTMVRQGLRAMLAEYQDVEIVGEAWDGQEAVQAVDQIKPDVVLMDINMPNMNGIDATAQIKARHPDTIVIGLSVNTDRDQEAMLKAGANLLLSKEAPIDQLYQTIHAAVHDHSTSKAPSV